MTVKQLFTQCLAEMAYYVSDKGEAVIIDPLREIAPYMEMAAGEGATIKYIFLTHFHADFVSGHVDLARKTGATIVLGPTAQADFDFYEAKDGELFPVGDIFLKLLHTPGHTLESSSLLLIDEAGNSPFVFTGDALFIGEVGRPDLAVSTHISREDLAGLLFDSLREKIMTLPEDIIIYPNHGAGSSCGKNISEETSDTLGNQKRTNYALRPEMSREEFIAEVAADLELPPWYFSKNALMNKRINAPINTVIAAGSTPIEAAEFKFLSEKDDYLVVDTRINDHFVDGTVPGAWYIGMDGTLATCLGTLVEDIDQKILLVVSDASMVEDIVTRFARIGYDKVQGYLSGGIQNWLAQGYTVQKYDSISAYEFVERLNDGSMEMVLDVREKPAYLAEHIQGIANFPINRIHGNIAEIDFEKHYFLFCNSGYKSVIAASILRSYGVKKITVVLGGMVEIRELMDL